jgi:hypothetical protein
MSVLSFSKVRAGLAVVIAALFCSAVSVRADWSVDVEGGVAFGGYNDVRIPGNTGTDLSLTDDIESDEVGFFRFRVTAPLGQRHRLSVLVAPLRIEGSGTVDRDVDFNGVLFTSGQRVNSRYRFDSYRLTYSYTVVESDRLRLDLGFTAKVRDASIKLEGENESSEKTNTGFVPLINFAIDWSLTSKIGLLLEGDALAAPQGRAEDVLAAAYTNITDRLRLRLGYRILEGGADNDEVYTFALVHYVSAGLTLMF